MSPRLTCTRIVVDRTAQLFEVYWADKHTCRFPLDGLKRACPCADCQGHEKMHLLPDPALFKVPALMKWTKVRAELAGSVGVRLIWDDGHSSGIYTWERLRAMCTCD
ncbi:MAG: DUF971 domain-containing protein [Bacteroidota bacterium]|nr:DUF971 domain-containing protein [Bacteroidota bacterium]MDE2955419.1 DUF971 domain-containing protein [Bacteroidota bacterium]